MFIAFIDFFVARLYPFNIPYALLCPPPIAMGVRPASTIYCTTGYTLLSISPTYSLSYFNSYSLFTFVFFVFSYKSEQSICPKTIKLSPFKN